MNKLFAFIAATASFVLLSISTQAQQFLRHTVEYGETIYSIPVHYGITTKQFMAINSMTYDNIELKPGQVVAIRELTAEEIAQAKPVVKPQERAESTAKPTSAKEEMIKKIREEVEASNAKALEQAKIEQQKWEQQKAAEAKAEEEQLKLARAEEERLAKEAAALQQKAKALELAKQEEERKAAALKAKVASEQNAVAKAKVTPAKIPSMPAAENESVGPNGVKYIVSSTGYHLVQKQQTMYHLSKIYNIPLEDLKRINNMATTDLAIGQKLKVRN
ncbi:MAG: LysM peptidoglycan-binding domain-containing protein [Bacteroidetes bacterium]|nr:LysM peptidoglycan-binding domain-containing protein [Bacteroidota bacterium]MBK8658888.1 LysM peptidoglycan-binding domain-containing protein [Bacteroidota bacterium]